MHKNVIVQIKKYGNLFRYFCGGLFPLFVFLKVFGLLCYLLFLSFFVCFGVFFCFLFFFGGGGVRGCKVGFSILPYKWHLFRGIYIQCSMVCSLYLDHHRKSHQLTSSLPPPWNCAQNESFLFCSWEFRGRTLVNKSKALLNFLSRQSSFLNKQIVLGVFYIFHLGIGIETLSNVSSKGYY